MPRQTAGKGALAGAVGLLLVAWLGAAPAAAQENPDRAACSIYAELLNDAGAFCNETGCAPTEKECQRICNGAEKSCKAVAGSLAKTADAAIRGEAKQDKLLCKTAEDPDACRSSVVDAQKDAKTATRDLKKDTQRNCRSEALVLQCVSSCTQGNFSCECVGGLVLDCSLLLP